MTQLLTEGKSRPAVGPLLTLCVALAVIAVSGLLVPALAQPSPHAVSGDVTFTKDVKPILQANCEACHRPGAIGPMALTTYESVQPWARTIKRRVAHREMPPWPYDRTVGIQELKYDRSLSDQEIQTIVAWVDGGTPEGNPADLPPPIEWPDYSDYWELAKDFGPPDFTVTTEPYLVAANGLDQWFDSSVPVEGLKEERWIRAIEIRPSTPEAAYVFHHGNSSLRQKVDGEEQSNGLIAAAVGKMYDLLPSDSGMRIAPGARVESGIHYFRVYPGFPTLFWGLSVFFVGDLMGKALWKLVENAARFPRRGGRVLCVHGAVSFHRARPCGPRWLPGRGAMRDVELDRRVLGLQSTGEYLCSRQNRRPVQAERSIDPGKTGISGTYAIWETRI